MKNKIFLIDLPLFVISIFVEDMSWSIRTPNKVEYLMLVFRVFVSSSLVNNRGFMRYKFLSLMACVSERGHSLVANLWHVHCWRSESTLHYMFIHAIKVNSKRFTNIIPLSHETNLKIILECYVEYVEYFDVNQAAFTSHQISIHPRSAQTLITVRIVVRPH